MDHNSFEIEYNCNIVSRNEHFLGFTTIIQNKLVTITVNGYESAKFEQSELLKVIKNSNDSLRQKKFKSFSVPIHGSKPIEEKNVVFHINLKLHQDEIFHVFPRDRNIGIIGKIKWDLRAKA